MSLDRKQRWLMGWILFVVFVCLFIIIVIGTLAAVFFDFGNLTEQESDTLFYVFLVEIGVAVVALFYSIFGLKKRREEKQSRVRLNLGEYSDVTNLIGKTATLSPSDAEQTSLPEVECKVLDDQGPYIPINLPPAAYSVYVTIDTTDNLYSGSFIIGNYLVDMTEEK